MGWQIFERAASDYERWYATGHGRRVDEAERALLGWLFAASPSARIVLDIGCGTVNRWSLGGLSRRIGQQARRPVLGSARDMTPCALRRVVRSAAGDRLRSLRWASTLFPGGLWAARSRLPLGDVIGMAATLSPPGTRGQR